MPTEAGLKTGLHNTSEIGRLRKVMLHRPGRELENLMPEYLERLLFDDIPYLKVAQAEHDAFAQCLRDNGAEVVYLRDLVEETIAAIRPFVESGRISQEELDKKVYRILDLKYRYGLFFDHNNHEEIPEAVIQDKAIVNLAKQAARRSVLVGRDKEGWLPLKKDEKILVVEQKVKAYNSFQWHSGILYENCLKYNPNTVYQETDYTWDEKDQQTVFERADEFDTVVVTNYFIRGKLCNREAIEELIEKASAAGKKVVVVTNTPYEEISIPHNAKCVVITFATSPENIKVTAGALFGEIQPEGVWPVKYHG